MIALKKVFRKDHRIHENRAKLELVKNEFDNSRSDLKNVTNLFKDNADFITYGISAMTFPF